MRRSVLTLAGMTVLASGLAIRAASPPAEATKSGIDREYFNPDIRPQDDLYRHVNGKWLAEAKIPPDRPFDGAFIALRDQAEADLRAIIETAAKSDSPENSIARKVGDLYASYMDEDRAEKLGMDPIKDDLAAVAAIKDRTS